jgi:hypothetical protein
MWTICMVRRHIKLTCRGIYVVEGLLDSSNQTTKHPFPNVATRRGQIRSDLHTT